MRVAQGTMPTDREILDYFRWIQCVQYDSVLVHIKTPEWMLRGDSLFTVNSGIVLCGGGPEQKAATYEKCTMHVLELGDIPDGPLCNKCMAVLREMYVLETSD